jgi:adenosyl cobinamide kinase/adenosyl cobinamide phosphate guanylyltransferase
LSERALSVRQDLLITGANSSGKTRWLAKLDDKAPEVWPDKEKIFIRAMEPLQRWYDDPRVAAHMVAKGKAWDKLKTYERIDALVDWVKSTRAVVLLDDAHKLAGRKLDIAIQLCREAGRLVVGAWAENNISMSLRMLIDKRDPQRVPLDSEAAYDVTQMAMWLLILAAMGAGWWQLAAVVGGMKVLAGGRRAARQT